VGKDYKYFYGHIVPEIADQLSNKRVICWKNDHVLSLPTCALKKFWHGVGYCKRCELFQEDVHAQVLKGLVIEWEKDPFENESEI
jgi:hypothetical protein